MVELRPFQRTFIRHTTAPGIDTAALSLPRGNGKSWLAAHLLRRCLSPGDELYVPGSEYLLCAASIEQARLCYRFIRAELEPTGGYSFIDSATRIGITHKRSNTRLRVLSSNGKTAMGIVNCPLLVADEPGSWEVAGGTLMFDAIITALGKPNSPMRTVFIGTLAPAMGGWWHDLIADGSGGTTYVQSLQGNAETWDTWAEIRRCNPLTAISGDFRKRLLVVGRGFAASEVTGPDSLARALTPGVLELVGRSLIRTGEVVFLIDTTAGKLRLIPAETHDVEGGPYVEEWEYRLTLGGPSKTVTHEFVPAQSVLHFRYAVDASTPWRGNGPIAVANLAGKLSAETVNALANESSGPVGRLLGIPVDGQDATVQALKADIRDARGRTALIETGDWANSGGGSKVDLKTERFGAEPPASLVQLVTIASQKVYSACGLNQALWGGSQAAAVREAWRLCLFGVLSPLGRLVEAELQDKLEDTVTLSWQELRASDLSGRARAFQSMVGGGMEVERAAGLAGLTGVA